LLIDVQKLSGNSVTAREFKKNGGIRTVETSWGKVEIRGRKLLTQVHRDLLDCIYTHATKVLPLPTDEVVIVFSQTKILKEYSGETKSKSWETQTKWLKEKNLAEFAVNYKLRDWIFSRQRYWGEPIPLVFCPACKKRIQNSKFKIQNLEKNQTFKIQNYEYSLGEILNPGWIAIPEEELPLTLPKVEKYQPTGTGESPLAAIKEWVNTKCPKCGSPARRETNTMPQWAGSCWYFIRYVDPNNDKTIADKKLMEYWLPVDFYVGGAEHAVLHLLYSRFWIKVLYDAGVVNFDEPFCNFFSCFFRWHSVKFP